MRRPSGRSTTSSACVKRTRLGVPGAARGTRFSGDHLNAMCRAVARIQAGADWLAAKGLARVLLLSHSMGSWMANVYYERTQAAPFAAWICIGLTGGFGRMGNVKVPVLDLYGEKDLVPVLRADGRRRRTLEDIPGSKQVMIPGSDHHYTGREKELVAEIQAFIARLK